MPMPLIKYSSMFHCWLILDCHFLKCFCVADFVKGNQKCSTYYGVICFVFAFQMLLYLHSFSQELLAHTHNIQEQLNDVNRETKVSACLFSNKLIFCHYQKVNVFTMNYEADSKLFFVIVKLIL